MVSIRASLLPVLACALSVSAYFLPPKGAITVGGKNGKYANLATALNDTSSDVFFVYGGNYTGQVYITRSNVKIYGQTLLDHTYLGNTVTLSNNLPASIAGSNDLSGTVRVRGTNVSLSNLNIENTYGHPVTQSQAIALSLQGDKFAGYGVKVSGWQDTLLANTGGSFFSNSWIEGEVDFIFGQRGSLWITQSVLHTVADGYLTASGRSTDDPYWYVIDRSLIFGNGTTYLGRPWRNYARVVFQNNYLGSNVNRTGWSIWSPTDQRTNHTTFAEYNNYGPGAVRAQRSNFSQFLDAPVSITTVLNTTDWIDSRFL